MNFAVHRVKIKENELKNTWILLESWRKTVEHLGYDETKCSSWNDLQVRRKEAGWNGYQRKNRDYTVRSIVKIS